MKDEEYSDETYSEECIRLFYSTPVGEMTKMNGEWFMRVPGGWLFMATNNADDAIGGTFIPYSDEFNPNEGATS